MKSLALLFLSLALPFNVLAQGFTKLNNAALTANTSDWFSVAPVDIDNNYTLDLILGNNGSGAYFLHKDSLDFVFNNSKNFVGQTGNTVGSFWADLDNDCNLDVFWVNQSGNGNNYLYENNGDGTFTRITTSTLSTETLYGSSAAWGDYDNDGLVDLHVARRLTSASGRKDRLYKNLGNFNFAVIDTGAFNLVSQNPSSGGSWVDFDNDGDIDLYVANRNNNNNDFYINNGNGSFTLDTSTAIVMDGANSTGSSWGDYDNDGFMDVFVSNVLGEKNHLYHNNGDGTFTKVLTGSIVNDLQNTFGAFWADFDNDGYLDLFTANNSNLWPKRNILYKNNGNGTFTKLNSGSQYTELLETFGTTSADLNEDGFVDIINPNRYNGPITIHLNDGNANGYLHLNLMGTTSNRSAIGARVVAKSALGKQTRAILQQTGYNNHDDLSIKMGFAQDANIDSLIVYWPAGGTCVFTNITPKGFYWIKEGTCVMDTVTESNFSDSSSFLSAHFTNLSKGALNSYHWDFGDGDTSVLKDPIHHYASPGKYEVKLTVYDDYCKHRTYKDSIDICPDTSLLGFTDFHLGKSLTFTDTSVSNAFNFQWDFGDNASASGTSVSHTYAQPGAYAVCLTLTDSCRSKTFCDTITVCNDTLLAGFGSGGNSLTVSFNDSSLNATSITWDFGDGGSSTSANPTHTYTAPGYYYVCQTVQDFCTSSTFCDTIGVCLDTAVSGFAYSASGNTFSFTDQSANANTYLWDFGDGNLSTLTNPSHTYQTYGTYKVCLTVTNDCYTDSTCQMINSCAAPGQASYSYQGSPFTQLAVQFQSQSQNAVSHLWDFDDGSLSTNKNPLKVFSNPLLFNVCLSITDSCGNTDSTCQAVDLTRFGTKELQWLHGLKVYPNPSTGIVFIKGTSELAEKIDLEVTDMNGQVVIREKDLGSNETLRLDIHHLAKGLYLLKINAGEEGRTLRIEKS